MPRVTVINPECQGETGRGERGEGESAYKLMEELKDGEGKPAERSEPHSISNQIATVSQPQQTSWPQTLSTLRPWKECYSFALVGVVWLVSQVEAPLQPSLLLAYVCWRLFIMCLLWLALGGCVHLVKRFLLLGQKQFKEEPPVRVQHEVVTENRNNQYTWVPLSGNSVQAVPLADALADSLLQCVLQEPLPDPSMPHIMSLLSRLESVSYPLQSADMQELHQDSILTDKVKLIHNYLQQRTSSLTRLAQVQGAFEASVKDMLEGLDGLWARLEVLHTGVTFTKSWSRGHKDLASARTEAENLSTVLGQYKKRLQCCNSHLNDSTQLLQELTWSHTHVSNSVSSSTESVWPEMLLQSNIEQFDKVQENFLSLEQQISTFQAHLEGLGRGNHNGSVGNFAHAQTLHPVSLKMSDVSPEHQNSTSVSTSVSSVEENTGAPLSLRERSALNFSSAVGRLRKSGKRK